MERKVACYGSCIRPKFWMEMWEHFTKTNEIEFEMIMVGHIKPDYELPKNIHHVFSEEKPAACVEISRRVAHASGCKYMLNITDDYFRFSDNFLDKLVEDVDDACAKGYRNYITCAMFRVSPNHPWDKHDTPLIYHNSRPNSPQLQSWMCLLTEVSKTLGSTDKRFHGQYQDVDLQMRNYEQGGVGGQQKEVEMTERTPEPNALAKRCSKISPNDRQILDSFWNPVIDGKRGEKNRYFYQHPTKRKKEVKPYTDEDLKYLNDNGLSSWEEFWIKKKSSQ